MITDKTRINWDLISHYKRKKKDDTKRHMLKSTYLSGFCKNSKNISCTDIKLSKLFLSLIIKNKYSCNVLIKNI